MLLNEDIVIVESFFDDYVKTYRVVALFFCPLGTPVASAIVRLVSRMSTNQSVFFDLEANILDL